MTAILGCGPYRLSLARPLVMGIVNVTPDSFYDGGRHGDARSAIEHARRLAAEGADLLDIGGESSRPGAEAVAVDEELRRVLPVLEGAVKLGIPASVDTTKPAVMRAAIDHGAAMINDITALAAPGALEVLAQSTVAVCLMHMQGEPRTMQANPTYGDVVAEVRDFLAARAEACIAAGIAHDRIAVDPGFGFGKTVQHNVTLLRRLPEIASAGFPVLAGWSRKSSLGHITGRAPEERLAGSLAAALIAVQRGARIVRVHDVAATRDALAVLAAVEGSP
jgi:dihydropteroate synthase